MQASLKVLIIEDSEDSCMLLVEELSRKGFGVDFERVETAAEFRAALAQARWDAVIADFFVPGLGALEALRLLKAERRDLPFIVVSGTLGEEMAVQVMKAGAHDFVTKGNLVRLMPALEREIREARDRAARRQNEALFRGVVESLGEGLILTNLDGVVWYANGRILDMTGFQSEDLADRPFHQACTPPELWSETREKLERVAKGATERFEMPLLRCEGERFWAAITLAPLRDLTGKIIGAVAAISDITERHVAREALRRSEASLRLAQRVARIGSWELNLETERLEWSEETYRIFGRDSGQFTPSRQAFLEAVHPDDRTQVRKASETALGRRTSYGTDHRIVLPGGDIRFVHEQAEILFDGEGKPARLAGTVQDITERKELEEQLRQSQKMEAVGQLAGGIAHDFNNILTIIQGYIELVLLDPHLSREARHQLEQVVTSSERATKLTRQLLAFSRKQLLQFKPVHLNDLLHQLAGTLQRFLGEHIQLELRLPKPLACIRADAGMLEQILINLTVNSRDAMPRGGRLIIESSAHEIDSAYCRIHPDASPGEYICLSVSDTGLGMDAENLKHIFEPFFTTKEVGKGTGLGLSTVYGIVKQHQGWIQVSSQPEAGTVFKIFFPVHSEAGLEPEVPPVRDSVRGGQETILLVEDEPALRNLARQILEQYGYQIVEAGSGPEALEQYAQTGRRIDLLLTDMVMPGGMTGRELARRVDQLQPSLKVLYVSGYSIDFVKDEFALTEGLNFIAKPYSGTALARAVRETLDRSK